MNGFRTHLEAAERLLREGRGADAVPELDVPSTSGVKRLDER